MVTAPRLRYNWRWNKIRTHSGCWPSMGAANPRKPTMHVVFLGTAVAGRVGSRAARSRNAALIVRLND